jgi:hypothetical protein
VKGDIINILEIVARQTKMSDEELQTTSAAPTAVDTTGANEQPLDEEGHKLLHEVRRTLQSPL